MTLARAMVLARTCIRINKWGDAFVRRRELSDVLRRRGRMRPETIDEAIKMMERRGFDVRRLAAFILDPVLQLELPLL